MVSHPIHAALYDPMMGVVDRAGLAEQRRRLTADAKGQVLEIGAGTGRNLPLYREVDGVTVLEPDPSMRRRLLDRMAAAAVPVEVHEGTIEDAGFAPGSFDTVVCSLVLCTVDDPAVALANINQLVKPEGRLLFLEHVKVPGWRGAAQNAVTPLWRRVSGGCHLNRETLDEIREAGFVVTDCWRRGVLVRGMARKK